MKYTWVMESSQVGVHKLSNRAMWFTCKIRDQGALGATLNLSGSRHCLVRTEKGVSKA